MKAYLWFVLFFILLLLFEFLKLYFIMPFPGSQTSEMVWLSYPIHVYRWVFRSLIGLGFLLAMWRCFKISTLGKVISFLGAMFVCLVYYGVGYVFSAEAMFKQLERLSYVDAKAYESSRIIIGINRNDEAKAYPIEMLGYHHYILDSLANQPYLLSYCTVCHSGRVYSPVVDGKLLRFRLVGMDLFNAMLEDNETGSWWRQASGECIAGPFKGRKLTELPFVQCSVAEWVKLFPGSYFLKEDSRYKDEYRSIDGFAVGEVKGGLIGVDTTGIWSDKAWIIGVEFNGISKAYLWNDVVKRGPLVDSIGNSVIEIYANEESHDFFVKDYLTDSTMLSFQEFWHSWKAFHPNTLRKIDY